ncbi:SUMF1/EgtB/PvdO family nonheme iron enzyme [Trichothermofontia sp.]
MSYCLNPDCRQPQNPKAVRFCQTCGAKLLLRDRYRAVRQLGEGGFGRTFLAIDEDRFQSACVIKQFSPPPEIQHNPKLMETAMRLFNEEAQRLHQLEESPQIPRLLAHFDQTLTQATPPRPPAPAQIPTQTRTDHALYLVQEYIEGQNLQAELEKAGLFSEGKIQDLLADLLPLLHFIHQHRVVHRDIKPENIVRRTISGQFGPQRTGAKAGQLVLLDFGASRQLTNSRRPGTVVGSLGYAAPEQLNGRQVGFATDLYGLGATCLYLLTGRSPLELYDLIGDRWCWQTALPKPLRPELVQILDRLLARSPKERYATASEVLRDLKAMPTANRKRARRSRSLAPGGASPQPPAIPSPSFSLAQSALPRSPGQPLPTPGASSHRSPAPQSLVTATVTAPAPTYLIPPALPPRLQPVQVEGVTLRRKRVLWHRTIASVYHRHQAQVFEEFLGNQQHLTMVMVPDGIFLMGATPEETGSRTTALPQHLVTVAAFAMSQTPITQAQWQAVMGTNPAYFQGEHRPVETVSWNEATEFCRRLQSLTGRSYRLPSEAEWEYACRAGTTTPFHFGEVMTAAVANYDASYAFAACPTGKYRQQTTSVGSFRLANAFGFYDMHGNVWEWCADPWHDNYVQAPTYASIWESEGDPGYRVLRGGSWFSYAGLCRSWVRDGLSPLDRRNDIGFRVVCSL